MTDQYQLKRMARAAGSALVQFIHGGLLVAGILAAAFVVSRAGALGARDAGSQQVGGIISQLRAVPVSEDGLQSEALAPEMRGVVDYLSRRYRVADQAIEPLVSAAGAAGERLGLEPMLIVAVMAVESGFNPIAESSLGAQGLMQVIPRFHQDKLDPDAGPEALLDPRINILVGARVLQEYIRRTGSLRAGLQQYGGAAHDASAQYAMRVLGEKSRLDAVLRRSRQAGA